MVTLWPYSSDIKYCCVPDLESLIISLLPDWSPREMTTDSESWEGHWFLLEGKKNIIHNIASDRQQLMWAFNHFQPGSTFDCVTRYNTKGVNSSQIINAQLGHFSTHTHLTLEVKHTVCSPDVPPDYRSIVEIIFWVADQFWKKWINSNWSDSLGFFFFFVCFAICNLVCSSIMSSQHLSFPPRQWGKMASVFKLKSI